MPIWLQIFLVFFYGSVLGSFVGVVFSRYPSIRGGGPARVILGLSYPPSACPACGRNIRWFENIPVVSYLCLGGKCSSCKVVIPLWVLQIEVGFGFAGVIAWLPMLS